MDPALREDGVAGAIDAGRDGAGGARLVVVVSRRGGAVRIGHLLTGGDVPVAHVRLDVPEGGSRTGRRGSRRRRGPLGGTRVGGLGGRSEDEDRQQCHARDGPDDHDEGPMAFQERRLVGDSLAFATASSRAGGRRVRPRARRTVCRRWAARSPARAVRFGHVIASVSDGGSKRFGIARG